MVPILFSKYKLRTVHAEFHQELKRALCSKYTGIRQDGFGSMSTTAIETKYDLPLLSVNTLHNALGFPPSILNCDGEEWICRREIMIEQSQKDFAIRKHLTAFAALLLKHRIC